MTAIEAPFLAGDRTSGHPEPRAGTAPPHPHEPGRGLRENAQRRRDPARSAPDGAEQRVGDPADERDELAHPRTPGPRHERGGREPDEQPGEDVARIMHPERDAREPDEGR